MGHEVHPLTPNYPKHGSGAIPLTILISPSQLHPEPNHHTGTRHISEIPEAAGDVHARRLRQAVRGRARGLRTE